MPVDPAPSGPSSDVFVPGLMKGKVLFVTGGGSGIGLGICLGFARLGARVAICGRTEKKLQEATEAIRRSGSPDAMYVQADVRKAEELVAAANSVGEKWGKIDVLVSNAAGNFMSLMEDVSPNAFSTVVDIDLRGTFHTALAGLPWLRKAAQNGNGALMISISATLYYTGMPFQGHAAAAKAGIDSLTKTFAAEWSDDGIRVVRNAVPLGRYGTVDDIANTAIFLASPGGNFITGTNVVVDGMQWQAVGVSGMLSVKDQIRNAMKAQREGRQRGSGSKGHAADKQAKL